LSDLASGEKTRPVPYGQLKNDTASFIADEYRPVGLIYQDPRNMNLQDIRKGLKHCYGRQAELGPKSAFRFSHFIGPRRQKLFALYPDQSHPASSNLEKNHRKKKNKGKQRENPLEGLLRIDESVEAPTPTDQDNANQPGRTPTAAGPSGSSQNEQPTASTSRQNDLVRIDMGQMLQLKEMGYEVAGPVNGPNEGYPEYEVCQAVLQALVSRQTPNPLGPSEGELGPDPALFCIDPSLLGQADDVLPVTIEEVADLTSQHRQPSPNATVNQYHSSGMAGPSTPHRTEADLAQHSPGMARPSTPQRTEADQATMPTLLGKRAQNNLSPQTVRRTRNSKKKKVTDDDLAALEAEKMVQAGTKRKRKPTGRK
jgi:hypothetical protein